MPPTIKESFKILVTGGSGVGKSAFVVKYLTGRFIWEYQSEQDSVYERKLIIDNEDINLEILDSVKLNERCIKWADGFIIVYDVTDLKSFERVAKIKQEIESVKNTNNLAFVIVGTKVDLIHGRKVSEEMADEYAQKLVAAHFECSSCTERYHKTTLNISEVFTALCRDLALQKQNNFPCRRQRKSSLSQIKLGLKNFVSPNRTKSHSVSVTPSLPQTLELSSCSSQSEIGLYRKVSIRGSRSPKESPLQDKNLSGLAFGRRRHALSSPNLRRSMRNSIVA